MQSTVFQLVCSVRLLWFSSGDVQCTRLHEWAKLI